MKFIYDKKEDIFILEGEKPEVVILANTYKESGKWNSSEKFGFNAINISTSEDYHKQQEIKKEIINTLNSSKYISITVIKEIKENKGFFEELIIRE